MMKKKKNYKFDLIVRNEMKTRNDDGERRVEEESKAMRRKTIVTFGTNLYVVKLFVYISKKERTLMLCLLCL